MRAVAIAGKVGGLRRERAGAHGKTFFSADIPDRVRAASASGSSWITR